jgi:hypothetical protein
MASHEAEVKSGVEQVCKGKRYVFIPKTTKCIVNYNSRFSYSQENLVHTIGNSSCRKFTLSESNAPEVNEAFDINNFGVVFVVDRPQLLFSSSCGTDQGNLISNSRPNREKIKQVLATLRFPHFLIGRIDILPPKK